MDCLEGCFRILWSRCGGVFMDLTCENCRHLIEFDGTSRLISSVFIWQHSNPHTLTILETVFFFLSFFFFFLSLSVCVCVADLLILTIPWIWRIKVNLSTNTSHNSPSSTKVVSTVTVALSSGVDCWMNYLLIARVMIASNCLLVQLTH